MGASIAVHTHESPNHLISEVEVYCCRFFFLINQRMGVCWKLFFENLLFMTFKFDGYFLQFFPAANPTVRQLTGLVFFIFILKIKKCHRQLIHV